MTITESIWEQIGPQINEWVEETLEINTLGDSLLEPLQYKSHWCMMEPFRKVDFEYENARFTLAGLCNTVEMILGSQVEEAVCEGLRLQILDVVNTKLELRSIEQQQILVYEHEQEIEREEVA